MRSMMVPVDRAPPAHIVINAVVWSVRSSSCSAVVISRLPVDPTGWPSAMAPPLTLTLAMSGSCTRAQDNTTEANASLISTRSMSPIFMPAFSSTLAVDCTGPSRW